VTKRLKALQEKLDTEQAKELRLEQNTYRLIRSSAGLGMTITPQCDIDAVTAGSAAEAAGVPTKFRIKSINGKAVDDKNSIIKLVQQVEMGKELEFLLEPGGYQHNPVLGADKPPPPPRPASVPAALVPLSEA
jgi:membrane-associated protease RseP (regulator of RpoE activity)